MRKLRIAGRALPVLAGMAFAASLVFSAGARAAALTDLRAKLVALAGQAPIQALLSVKTTTVNKKENGGKPETADADFVLRMDDGLSIHIERATLQQAARELAAAASNADHPTPTVSLLERSTDAMTLVHLLNEGPNLLRKLSGATTATEKSSTLWGRSAREITVLLPAPKASEIKLKDYSDQFSIWLDSDGVPLAAAEQARGKGCMLFLCMRVQQSSSYTLRVIGERLVATGLTLEQKQTGLGQDSDTHTAYALEIQGVTKTGAPAAGSRQDCLVGGCF